MRKKSKEKQAQENLLNELAYHELRKMGYKILLRNYESNACAGELDLIAKHEGDLVFVSVNRTPERMPSVYHLAVHYMKRYGITAKPFRFDSVHVVPPCAETKFTVTRNV